MHDVPSLNQKKRTRSEDMATSDDIASRLRVLEGEHELIFRLLHHLCAEQTQRLDSEHFVNTFSELIHALGKHVHSEESLMRDIGFSHSEFEAHRQAHNALLEECLQINAQSMTTPQQLIRDACGEILSEFRRHVATFDSKFDRSVLRFC
jgi:hemerythrin